MFNCINNEWLEIITFTIAIVQVSFGFWNTEINNTGWLGTWVIVNLYLDEGGRQHYELWVFARILVFRKVFNCLLLFIVLGIQDRLEASQRMWWV